jgi:hypothetical protein
MFVRRFLGKHLGSPLVGGRVAITMEDLGGVVAEKGIDLLFTLRTISMKEVGQVLSEPYN